jgi:hypothetical protein
MRDIVTKYINVLKRVLVVAFFLIFLASGIGKLMEPRVLGAANALVMTFGVPFSLAVFAIFLVSNGEILLSVLLMFKRFRSLAITLLVPSVLVMFLVFLLYVHFKGIILDDCGCFGGLWRRTIQEAIVEEMLFIAIWIIYFVIQYKIQCKN